MFPTGPAAGKPSLRRELLFNFALLAGAALSLAVLAALIAQSLRPGVALVALLGLILADVVVIFLFGRYLITRLVLRPMADLVEAAEALAAGDLEQRAPAAETREFTEVAERFNRMTERLVDAQSQLVRAEKLASLGHLAAGIAHEVGNPLSAIGNYLEVLRERGGDSEVIVAIEHEAQRIDRIVRGLLDYARPGNETVGRVEVGATLETVLDLLDRQGVLKQVSLVTEIEDDLPPVRGAAHRLEQVVVNLLLNAAEAAAGGTVVVGAGRWRYRASRAGERRRGDAERPSLPDRHEANRRPPLPNLAEDADGVLVWVADSGPGILGEDRARVFEPFFTTKDPGRSTGLGLAVVQRLIHEAGGAVWVDRAREGGAAFKFFLPAALPARGTGGADGAAGAARDGYPAASAPPAASSPGGEAG